MGGGVFGGALEAHVEAHGAADAAFRLPFHALGPREPVVLVVIRIDERHGMLFGKPCEACGNTAASGTALLRGRLPKEIVEA